MGALFDLVIADAGAAEAVGTTDHLFDDFFVLPTKMLDPITLDELFALIDPASPEIESWWETPLYEREELWVFQLLPYFIEKLAHLLEKERADLAERWAQGEQLRFFYRFTRLTADEIAKTICNLVDDLCVVAFEATERDQCVFLRCLP